MLPAAVAVVAPPPPNTPMMTFSSDRFIALHISTVRMVPADPTSIPPVSIAWLLYRNPPMAAATPVKLLRSEMTTGISAPPIGMTNSTP